MLGVVHDSLEGECDLLKLGQEMQGASESEVGQSFSSQQNKKKGKKLEKVKCQ